MGVINFFEKVGAKLNQGWHNFAGSADNVFAGIAETIGADKAADYLREKYEGHKAKEEYWKNEYNRIVEENHPKPKEIQSLPPIEEEDPELVERIKQRVKNNYSKLENMKKQDVVQRIETMHEMISDMAKEDYGVDITGLELYLPNPDDPDFAEDYSIEGVHIHFDGHVTEHYVRINATNIIYDDVDGYESVLLTAVHELMHAREWEAATRQKEFGYTNERLLEWYTNWLHGNYKRWDVDDEGYRKQPVERDAYRLQRVIKDYIDKFLKNK